MNTIPDLLAATAQVMGHKVSETALEIMSEDLAAYPIESVAAALKRLRTDGTRFNLAEIIKRLPNMWPGAEQAWAMFPRDESQSAMVCPEMSEAWGVAYGLDEISGRMAFKETYNRLVSERMAKNAKPEWFLSPGQDKEQRKQVALDAVVQGKLTAMGCNRLFPSMKVEELQQLTDGRLTPNKLLERDAPRIESPAQLVEIAPESVARESLEKLKDILGVEA